MYRLQLVSDHSDCMGSTFYMLNKLPEDCSAAYLLKWVIDWNGPADIAYVPAAFSYPTEVPVIVTMVIRQMYIAVITIPNDHSEAYLYCL